MFKPAIFPLFLLHFALGARELGVERKRLTSNTRKHGDLTSTPSPATSPLYQFFLNTDLKTGQQGTDFELQLPERLDLDVSDVGIVGRKVSVSVGGQGMGMGIVGFD